MALHLVKLCVGVSEVGELKTWQAERLAERRRRGEPAELQHLTRMTPKRAPELLDGGSLYWVIRGEVRVRQRLRAIRPSLGADGISGCALVLDEALVPTYPQPRRPFQGWRYLAGDDAPRDLPGGTVEGEELPAALRAELAALGLW